MEITADTRRIVTLSKRPLPDQDHHFEFTVRVWDATNGTQIVSHQFDGFKLELLEDGRHALLQNLRLQSQLLNLHDGRILAQIATSNVLWGSLARFFPEQHRLLVQTLSRSGDQLPHLRSEVSALQLLDTTSQRIVATLELGSRAWTQGIPMAEISAVSSDGERFLLKCTFTEACRVWVWDTISGKHQELIGHSGRIHGTTFFPDGARLITGGEDGTVRIWDAETGRELLTLTHTSPVHRVVVPTDGRSILTVSQKWGAVLWTSAPWNMNVAATKEVTGR